LEFGFLILDFNINHKGHKEGTKFTKVFVVLFQVHWNLEFKILEFVFFVFVLELELDF
jgi:hypothetical protein